jgi:hypothetical protein
MYFLIMYQPPVLDIFEVFKEYCNPMLHLHLTEERRYFYNLGNSSYTNSTSFQLFLLWNTEEK